MAAKAIRECAGQAAAINEFELHSGIPAVRRPLVV